MVTDPPPTTTGERNESSKYELLVKLAVGGMGAVYVATGRGAFGFESLVAVKRPHMHLLEAPEFRRAIIEEARIASRIRHVNVVAVRDVAVEGALVYLVMDYIEGVSLAQMSRVDGEQPSLLPPDVAIRIALDACAGLHAAHEARGDDGQLLGVIHRDVSPHNILVGVDGVARLTDFGIAKCATAAKSFTESGTVKGKLAYMAPEYIAGASVDRSMDVFALGVVVWEMLTASRLFEGANQAQLVHQLVTKQITKPSANGAASSAFDDAVLRALARDPKERFATAAHFGDALEAAARKAGLYPTHREVEKLVKKLFAFDLERRASAIRKARLEDGTIDISPSQLEPSVRAPTAPPSEATRRRALAVPAEIKVQRSTLKSADWAAIDVAIAESFAQPTDDDDAPLSSTVPAGTISPVAGHLEARSPRPAGSLNATIPLMHPAPQPPLAHVPPAATPQGVTGPTAFGKTADIAASKPSRRSWPTIAVLALLLIGGGSAALVMHRGRPFGATKATPSAQAEPSPTASAAAAPSAVPSASPSPSPSPSPSASASASASAVVPSASATPQASALATSSVRGRPVQAPRTPPASAPPASASNKLLAPPNPYAQ